MSDDKSVVDKRMYDELLVKYNQALHFIREDHGKQDKLNDTIQKLRKENAELQAYITKSKSVVQDPRLRTTLTILTETVQVLAKIRFNISELQSFTDKACSILRKEELLKKDPPPRIDLEQLLKAEAQVMECMDNLRRL